MSRYSRTNYRHLLLLFSAVHQQMQSEIIFKVTTIAFHIARRKYQIICGIL